MVGGGVGMNREVWFRVFSRKTITRFENFPTVFKSIGGVGGGFWKIFSSKITNICVPSGDTWITEDRCRFSAIRDRFAPPPIEGGGGSGPGVLLGDRLGSKEICANGLISGLFNLLFGPPGL